MPHCNCIVTLANSGADSVMEASEQPNAIETGIDLAKRGTGRWMRPAVIRLAAGSAEDGFNNNPDNAQPS